MKRWRQIGNDWADYANEDGSALYTGIGMTYMISAEMYAKAGNKAAFDRKAGFTRIQQQMILSFIDSHGSINRAETIELKGFALAARCSLTARASPCSS